jgi:hypothetical protein
MIKRILSAATVVITMVACNSNPKTDEKAQNTDTAYASWQARQQRDSFGAQPELPAKVAPQQAVYRSTGTKRSVAHTSSSSSSSNAGSAATGTGTGATTQAPAKKKGWSKTAKGAVIGGVAGAVGGAIINKKNPAAGAVIGGVLGAGTGAVVGNEMDKKDGRH